MQVIWLIAADPPAPAMTPFFWAALILGVGLLVWNTIEVGRNDAANVVNAVFGARILSRRWMIRVAALGVVLGAALAPGGIDPARMGAFNPRAATFEQAAAVYLSVYIVDAILLYACSAYSLPVSTTAILICSLTGAATVVGGSNAAATVPSAFLSMTACALASAAAAIVLQRLARIVLSDSWRNSIRLRRHGGWIAGVMMVLPVFLLFEMAVARSLFDGRTDWMAAPHSLWALPSSWLIVSALLYLGLCVTRDLVASRLFPAVAVVGTLCMALVFGYNDLANCVAPGASILSLIDLRRDAGAMADFVQSALPRDALFGCGIVLLMGMMTEHAQRVTRALIRTASMGDHVKLYATPRCIRAARKLLSLGSAALVPGADLHQESQRQDPALRSSAPSIIVTVSASVAAAAVARGVMVSTTLVVFAAVLGTGAADRVFRRGDAVLKLGRLLLCVVVWLGTAIGAFVGSAIVCWIIHRLGILGMIGTLTGCFFLRQWIKDRSDTHEARVRDDAAERINPDDFAMEDEG